MKNTILTVEEQIAILGQMLKTNGDGTVTESSLPYVLGKTSKEVTKYKAGIGTELSGRNNQIIDSNDKRLVSFTNFTDGDKLPAGKYLLITGVRMLIDTTNAVTVKTATWKTEATPNWKNSELHISQDGTGKLFEAPGTDLFNWKASTGNDADFRSCRFLIRPEAAFSFQMMFSEAAGAEAYKLEFRGYEYTDGSKN